MNKFRNVLLRKCKSLSRTLGRSSSYTNLRSMSTREPSSAGAGDGEMASATTVGDGAVVFVGSSRRRYVISAKHLSHPLIAALIDVVVVDVGSGGDERTRKPAAPIAVNCEVVLFDHLLWMLDNNAVDLRAGEDDDDAMRELAQLYAC